MAIVIPRESELIKIVNRLIQNSFGEGFQGNFRYNYFHDQMGIPEVHHPSRVQKSHKYLHVIAKKLALGFYQRTGQFGGIDDSRKQPPDGSVLEVLPQYESASRCYAELYQKEFNQEATIFVVSNLNPLNHTRRTGTTQNEKVYFF